MRRLHVLLAGCVIAGGAALLTGNDPGGSPAASLHGPSVANATPITMPSQVSATPRGAAPDDDDDGMLFPDRAARAPKAPIGIVDLDKITREDDHYVAPTIDGRKAVLTLEPELQELAEKLLNQSRAPKAGIVVMTPDGRILALAGRRTEEPKGSREGIFDWRLATDVWAPAASVFKLVTAAALVKAGVDPDGRVCYHGGIRSVLEHNLRDDRRDSRCESLAYGVAHSQNAIMGKLAYQHLEPATLEAAAKSVGWVDKIDHLKATIGELALPATKDLEFARAAAGFKGAKLSVMGGAVLTATFANDGERPVPRLVESIDGVPMPAPKATRAITAEQARAVAKMMAGTCTSGSAAKTFNRQKKVSVAGKTGTLTRTDPFYIEHSWFVGFAPADKPELVVSVLLGNPESWHLRGHEAAKRLIDAKLAPRKTARVRGEDRTVIGTR